MLVKQAGAAWAPLAANVSPCSNVCVLQTAQDSKENDARETRDASVSAFEKATAKRAGLHNQAVPKRMLRRWQSFVAASFVSMRHGIIHENNSQANDDDTCGFSLPHESMC